MNRKNKEFSRQRESNEPPNGVAADAAVVKINLYRDILIPLCKAKEVEPCSMSKSDISRELAIAKRLMKTKNVSAVDIVSCIQWLSKQHYATNLSMALVSVKIDFFVEWRTSVANVSQVEEPLVFECDVESIKPIDFDEWKEKREARQQKMEQYLKNSADAYAVSKKRDLCKVRTPEEAAELMRKIYGGKD